MSNENKEPSRLLPIQQAYNVRDLGGYPTVDNKQVKWRKLIRSGDLNLLTENDLNYLSLIPIISYIDLRGEKERDTAPDKKATSLKNDFLLPIGFGDMTELKELVPAQFPTLLVEANKSMARYAQETFKTFFRILMNAENTPLLFHCSAGKDRTGFAAALFLSSLGVSREIIMQDYLLSAEYVKKKYAFLVKANPMFAPLVTVEPTYLQAAFDVIDQEFGGIHSYLTSHLEVDLEKMKAIYTE